MLSAQQIIEIFRAKGVQSMHQHALLPILQGEYPDLTVEELRNSLEAAADKNAIAVGRDGFIRIP